MSATGGEAAAAAGATVAGDPENNLVAGALLLPHILQEGATDISTFLTSGAVGDSFSFCCEDEVGQLVLLAALTDLSTTLSIAAV